MSDILARRYARAFFDLAKDAGEIEKRGRYLATAVESLAGPEVALTLENPRVTLPQRVAVAEQVGARTSAETGNLLRLMIERGRIALLPQVATAYGRLADRDSGVVRADVTTAIPVDRKLVAGISEALARQLGREVQTEVTQDPSILGGLVIRIGDRVVDNSVRTHLQQLQAALA